MIPANANTIPKSKNLKPANANIFTFNRSQFHRHLSIYTSTTAFWCRTLQASLAAARLECPLLTRWRLPDLQNFQRSQSTEVVAFERPDVVVTDVPVERGNAVWIGTEVFSTLMLDTQIEGMQNEECHEQLDCNPHDKVVDKIRQMWDYGIEHKSVLALVRHRKIN